MILPRRGSTAWIFLSRPCLAEPPAESPSTRKISRNWGSRSEQSASLAVSPSSSRPPSWGASGPLPAPARRRAPAACRPACAGGGARRARAPARLRGADRLVGDLARGGGVLLER